MSEQEEMARLWAAAPVLGVTPIMDHGVKRAMMTDEVLTDHLNRLALYFFRGGVAYKPEDTEQESKR